MIDQPPSPDERMLELADMITAVMADPVSAERCRVMADMFRSTMIASSAPMIEVMWAIACLLTNIIRTHPEGRADWFDTVKRLLALAMEMGARKDLEDSRVH